MAESIRKSSPALIALAWAIVIAPTVWGLTFTVKNAAKIFSPAPAAAPAAPAATPGPHAEPTPRPS